MLYIHPRFQDDVAVRLQRSARGFPAMSPALPISIWPQAMLCVRPSSEIDFVSPVMACLVAV